LRRSSISCCPTPNGSHPQTRPCSTLPPPWRWWPCSPRTPATGWSPCRVRSGPEARSTSASSCSRSAAGPRHYPSMAVAAAPGTAMASRRPRWRLALLGGAAILAPTVQMLEWLRGRPIEVPVVAAGSIVMFLLIVSRTQGLTREVTVQDERRQARAPSRCRWRSTSRTTPWRGCGSATMASASTRQSRPAAPGGSLRPGRDA
jgi:hypothetical protein